MVIIFVFLRFDVRENGMLLVGMFVFVSVKCDVLIVLIGMMFRLSCCSSLFLFELFIDILIDSLLFC